MRGMETILVSSPEYLNMAKPPFLVRQVRYNESTMAVIIAVVLHGVKDQGSLPLAAVSATSGSREVTTQPSTQHRRVSENMALNLMAEK
jgi:hypothetical protein